MTIRAEAVTHRGPRHAQNEDSFFSSPETGLFAVADGMGGHRDGHLASAAVIEEIAGLRQYPLAQAFGHKVAAVDAAIHRANERLYRAYLDQPELGITGTTVVSLVLCGDLATCLWSGDSRLYLFRADHLFLLSEDHTDNVGRLTNAIGADADPGLEQRTIEVLRGDTFVLCTDGLFKGITETELADCLADWSDGAADRLLFKAIDGGSRDDITFIIAQVAG
ncbi:serine/threonine phosphoprotein phosphatase Stp1 [Roseibium aquae]|uniref:Serine/threonine phosphoprotein phosphatase Stp1 n=1 Tax=Roseibium aquae TaxID=1323746 RepID=A0A916X0Q6_9HYPH|nr:serine/threonine phosphoprotein phosphatase Stp1 [Roseibium aquae]